MFSIGSFCKAVLGDHDRCFRRFHAFFQILILKNVILTILIKICICQSDFCLAHERTKFRIEEMADRQHIFCLRIFRLRHHHINALLLSHAVHCVPCGLGAVLIVGDGVGSQLLAVCQHCLHCVANLVLHAEVQIFTVFHATGTVNDSCGAFGSDGVFHFPSFHILERVQLIQSRSINLTCAAPADTNQVTGIRLRRALDLVSGCHRIFCGSCRGFCRCSCLGSLCGLFHRSCLLCRLGLFGSGCGIAFLRQVALVHQSFVALLGSCCLRLIGSLLLRHLRWGCHLVAGGCHQGCLIAAHGNLQLRIRCQGIFLCGSRCLLGGSFRRLLRRHLCLWSCRLRSLCRFLSLRLIRNHIDFFLAVNALIASDVDPVCLLGFLFSVFRVVDEGTETNRFIAVVYVQEDDLFVTSHCVHVVRVFRQTYKYAHIRVNISSFHFWIGLVQLSFSKEEALKILNLSVGEIEIVRRNHIFR